MVGGSIPIISNPASIGASNRKILLAMGPQEGENLETKRPGKGYPQTPKKMSCEKDRKAGWQVDVDEKKTVRPRDSCLGRYDKIDGLINS